MAFGDWNFDIFTDPTGWTRMSAVIFGIIAACCAGIGGEMGGDDGTDVEKAFFFSVLIAICVMACFIALYVVGFNDNDLMIQIETVFYGVAGIVLIVVSCMFLAEFCESSCGGDEEGDCKITAGVFGLFEGLVCFSVVSIFFMS